MIYLDDKQLFHIVDNKLHEYKDLKFKLETLELKIQREKETVDGGLKGISYDTIRISSTNGISSSVENEIIRKEERLELLEKTKGEIQRDLNELNRVLAMLDQREKQLFELYYLPRKYVNIDGVAIQMLLDRSAVYHLKNKMIYKLIGYLYPEYSYRELPLLKDLY